MGGASDDYRRACARRGQQGRRAAGEGAGVKRIIPAARLPGLPRGKHFDLSLEDWWQLGFGENNRAATGNMPDWSKEDAYPKPEGLSHRAWGWEFLRRNPEYQLDWAWNDLRPARWALAAAID